MIKHQLKKVNQLSEKDCFCKFLTLLKEHYRFDYEKFHCTLGVSTTISNFPLRFRKDGFLKQKMEQRYKLLLNARHSESKLMVTDTSNYQ